MMMMYVEQAKINDVIFEKFGYEEEDVMTAIQKFNLMQDPEIMSSMSEMFKEMGVPPEAMGGGGGAGFPGFQ
jgi:hypothetical protein